jgi:hypothetical protein
MGETFGTLILPQAGIRHSAPVFNLPPYFVNTRIETATEQPHTSITTRLNYPPRRSVGLADAVTPRYLSPGDGQFFSN